MSPLLHLDHSALAQLSRRTSLPVMSVVAVQVAYLIALWSQRRRTRAHLRDMPAYLLRDIGLTGAESEAEMTKPFWRP